MLYIVHLFRASFYAMYLMYIISFNFPQQTILEMRKLSLREPK